MTKAKLSWLEEAQAALNVSKAFRRLGSTDVTLLLAIGTERVHVTFHAFEVAAIERDAADERNAELVLSLSPEAWNTYLAERRVGRAPSLLSLDLDTPGGVLRAADPLAKLKLERYNRSLQAFLDKGAELAA